MDVIAVNPTEHKRATRTRFLWIEKVLDGALVMSAFWPAFNFIQRGNEIKCFLTPFKCLCTAVTSVQAIMIWIAIFNTFLIL